jgi:hypothetical protein
MNQSEELAVSAAQHGAAVDVAQHAPVELGTFWHTTWVPQRPAAACASQLSAMSVGRQERCRREESSMRRYSRGGA